MKAAEVRQKSLEELKKLSQELREKLFESRFRYALGQSKQTAQLKASRRNLARLLTELRSRQLASHS